MVAVTLTNKLLSYKAHVKRAALLVGLSAEKKLNNEYKVVVGEAHIKMGLLKPPNPVLRQVCGTYALLPDAPGEAIQFWRFELELQVEEERIILSLN